MLSKNTLLHLSKRLIILFWALWFLLVSSSDLCNFLQHAHLLSTNFDFSSHNYHLVADYFKTYHFENSTLILSIFGFIVAFAWLVTILFWIAFFAIDTALPYLAYFVCFIFCMVFILAGEVFLQYAMEHGHIDRFSFVLVTFITFYLIDQHLSKNQ